MDESTTQALPLGPKSRSILAQVAFKGAIDMEVAGKRPEGQKLFETARALFDGLIALHDAVGAGDEPQAKRGGGGGYRGKSSGGGARSGGDGGGDKIVLDYFGNGQGLEFWDNRNSKSSPRSPDFKSTNKIKLEDGSFDNKALWLTDPDGEPIEWVQELVAKAEAGGATASASQAPDEAPF